VSASRDTEDGSAIQLERLLERLMAAVSDIRPFARDAAARERLKSVERQLAKLAARFERS
jgi:hypothetical protein